jgi:hypothetical protein
MKYLILENVIVRAEDPNDNSKDNDTVVWLYADQRLVVNSESEDMFDGSRYMAIDNGLTLKVTSEDFKLFKLVQ